MSIQTFYTALPFYPTHPTSPDERIAYLEATGRSRRRIIQPISCCLSPLTCPFVLVAGIISAIADGVSACGFPDCYSKIERTFYSCDSPSGKCRLFCLVCLPCTICADDNEDYLLLPEREEMNDAKDKKTHAFSLEIISKINGLNIIQMIYEYADEPVVPLPERHTRREPREFLGPGWGR